VVLPSTRHLALLLCAGLIWICPAARAAEKVVLVVGPFNRSLQVKELREFSNGGKPRGILRAALRISNVPEEDARSALGNQVDVPFTLLGRLLYTELGEAFLGRMATIFYPQHAPEVGIQALRSGAILSMAQSETGKVSPMDFLESYPNRNIVVDVPRLLYLLSRLDSVQEVSEFFREPF